MATLEPLLARNRSWALQKCQRDPNYFEEWIDGWRPHPLWIGCSGSRAPAEALTGSQPGEPFVHRNIANTLDLADDNTINVLQYVLHYLEVERVVLCGHYGCGSVQVAFSLPTPPLMQESPALTRRIGRPRHTLRRETVRTVGGCGVTASPGVSTSASTGAERSRHALDASVEASAHAQLTRLLESEPVQAVLASGRPLSLHGRVYDLVSGHLTTLIEYLSSQEHVP